MIDATIHTPAAGAWFRQRHLPHQLDSGRVTDLAWRGSWHRTAGDLRYVPGGALVVAVCGATAHLRPMTLANGEPVVDLVVVDDRPGVDACKRCATHR